MHGLPPLSKKEGKNSWGEKEKLMRSNLFWTWNFDLRAKKI